MKKAGSFISFFSIIALILVLNMDTSIKVDYPEGNKYGMPERINNLGLMQEKINLTIVTVAGIIIGLGLYLYGRYEENKFQTKDNDIIETYDNSKDYFCQKCGVENELDDEEANNKYFNCSVCNYKNIIS